MKVNLISFTVPCVDEIPLDSDVSDLIAFCARVSNPGNQLNTATADKLIKYLIKHKHWSPFEMANATLEIETTRDIARQILRHRSFTFQEFSQRYADPVKELTFETREARLQDQKNRQNSIEVDDENLQTAWNIQQQAVIDQAKRAYEWAIQSGIAKEVARSVLPEGLTMSRMYVNGTIIAVACAKAIADIFPMITEFVREESRGE